MKFSPFFKGHFAAIGNSGMGKGVFVSAVARAYRRQGIPVYLLTAKEDEYHSFPADFKTFDQDRFVDAVMGFKGSVQLNGEQQAIGVIAVIDEAWQWRWQTTKAGRGLEAIPNSGRSRGIEMWVQGQRYKQMPPNARGNCENLICFRQKNPEDIDDLIKQQGPEFAISASLKPGQFISYIGDRIEYGTAWEADENGKFLRGIQL